MKKNWHSLSLYKIYFFAVYYKNNLLCYKCGYTKKYVKDRIDEWKDDLRRKCNINDVDPKDFRIECVYHIDGVYYNEETKKYIFIGKEDDIPHSDREYMRYLFNFGITRQKMKDIMLPNGRGGRFRFTVEGLDFIEETSVEMLKYYADNFVNKIKSGELNGYSFTKTKEEYKKIKDNLEHKKIKNYNVVDFHNFLENKFCDGVPCVGFLEYICLCYSKGINDIDKIIFEYIRADKNDDRVKELLYNVFRSYRYEDIKRCIEEWLNNKFNEYDYENGKPLF